jgi:agmatinase
MQEPAFEYIRHGQSPFFRLKTAQSYDGLDAVLLGAPWDGGSTHTPGSRFAPWTVRQASARLQTFHPRHKIDVFATLNAVDGGNVPIPPFHPQLAREAIENEIERVVKAGAIPFTVGGDHSIAYPILRAIAKQHGPVALVHVDAHLDTSGPEVWGDPHHHGTPMRHAIEENLVAKGCMHQIGIRATWGQPEEGALAADHGARLWSVETVEDLGAEEVSRRIREAIGDRPVYVSFDVDGIDPAFAPGTGTPVPGGLTSREGIRLLQGLAGVRLVGMDVVEVCPARDVSDVTSTLAAHLLYEGLALAALGKRAL